MASMQNSIDSFKIKKEEAEYSEENFDDPKLNKEWSLNDFSIGKPLGKGRFGKVFLAKENRTKFQYLVALKILSKRILEESDTMINFKREYEIQSNLDHPNILSVYGFFYDNIRIYLILEYAPNGNLYKKLEKGPIDNSQAATYVLQTTRGLMHIHSKNITHRDIKPENLLLGYRGEIKIADFGWANYCNSGNPLSLKKIHTCKSLAGTLDYLCPEMILNQEHNMKVDNWCLGVLSYELLVGSAPFHANGTKETIELIKNVRYHKPPSTIDTSACKLISKLLIKDPARRLELNNVLNEEWIKKYANHEECFSNNFK